MPTFFLSFHFPKRNETKTPPCRAPGLSSLPQQPYLYLFLPCFLQVVMPSLVPGYVCHTSQPSHHLPLLHNHSRFSSNKSKFGNLVKYETPEGDLINSRSLNALRKYASLIARKIQRN
ncbi:hypothetical protein NC653_026737 [Populus alba x Populus x berolinensis]|nr:hypothetical protein NC653_026737 [Populus alba x Populus x berolinensis]